MILFVYNYRYHHLSYNELIFKTTQYMKQGSFEYFKLPSDFLQYKEVQFAIKSIGVDVVGYYLIVCSYLIRYKDAEATSTRDLVNDVSDVFDNPKDVLNNLHKVKLIRVRKNGRVYSRLLKVMLHEVKKVGHSQTKAEFHPLNEWLKKECVFVSRMKLQMSYKECEDLINKFGEKMVKETLSKMNNKPNITRKYTSVKQTCSNWCEMALSRKGNEQPKQTTAFVLDTKF